MIATGCRYMVQRAAVRSGHGIVEGTHIGVHDVVAMVKFAQTEGRSRFRGS
jgi:uncharacterized protein (DUF433 family)